MSDILKSADEMLEAQEARAKAISVEDILKQIKQHLFSCVVAGGYCRDVYHGVAHKDIDIVVFDVNYNDYAEQTLLKMLWKWLYVNCSVENITAYDDSDYDGEERIYMVWHLPHHNVDIIFYNAKTVTQVLYQFDCNLNQFYLPSTIPSFIEGAEYNPSLDESPVYAGSTPLEQLVFLKKLSEERMDKMAAKHRAFYPDSYGVPDHNIW